MIRIKQKGFTLVELLVVVGIIGILSTIATISFNSAQAKARDAKRVTDIKTVQAGLEYYSNEVGGYPASLATGMALGTAGSLSTGGGFAAIPSGNIHINPVPGQPIPPDGTCAAGGAAPNGTTFATITAGAGNTYWYRSANIDGSYCIGSGTPSVCPSYVITFCTGRVVSSLPAGRHLATPAGIQ